MANRSISRTPLEYGRHPAMSTRQDPDLLDELSYEHRHIERLWTELQRAHRNENGSSLPGDQARGAGASARDLGRELIEALARHEQVELDVLYPAAARVMNEEWVNHARDDHEVIRDLLDEVYGQDPAEVRIFEMFNEAMARVLAHILEEDKVLFPIMRIEVPRGQLTHPGHPAGPILMPGHPNVIDLKAAHLALAAAPRDTSFDGEVVPDDHPDAVDLRDRPADHGGFYGDHADHADHADHGGNGNGNGNGDAVQHDHEANGEVRYAGDEHDDPHGSNGANGDGATGNGNGNGNGAAANGGNGKRRRRLLRRN